MYVVARATCVVLPAALLLLAGCPATAPDDYEPNDTIAVSFDLGSVVEDEPEKAWSATISPEDDRDFFGFLAKEATSGTEFPGDDELFTLTLHLMPPQGPDARDYDLYLYDDAGILIESSANPDSAEETIVLTWDGFVGNEDSRSYTVEVRGAAGESSSTTYLLSASLTETFP
jgi:hypothetical protein